MLSAGLSKSMIMENTIVNSPHVEMRVDVFICIFIRPTSIDVTGIAAVATDVNTADDLAR